MGCVLVYVGLELKIMSNQAWSCTYMVVLQPNIKDLPCVCVLVCVCVCVGVPYCYVCCRSHDLCSPLCILIVKVCHM